MIVYLEGLRFETVSPSRFVFRLEERSEPIELFYRGHTWRLAFVGDKAIPFLKRAEALKTLRKMIDDAERKYKTRFLFSRRYND